MTENTISINMAADEAEDTVLAEETAEKGRDDAQGNDWQNILEEESGNVQTDAVSDAEKTINAEEKIKLTVYGEEVEVSLEEAKAAAQRGMAFDHMKGQLATARNNAHLRVLEDIARTKGTTLAALVSNIAHMEEVARLEKEYGDLNKVPMEVLGQSIGRLSQIKNELDDSHLAMKTEDWSRQLREYQEDNPGGKEIPPEVIENAKLTGSLALAYSDYNARQLAEQLSKTKAELELLKAEKQTSKGTPPSALSVAAYGEGEDDSFRRMMRSTW